MQVQTKYHGVTKIEELQILKFHQGIPGFLEEKQFIILPLEENSPFFILQSVNTSELAFVMVDPFSFYLDYEFSLTDSIIEQLQIDDEKQVATFVILTVQEPFTKTTANLQAPIVTNTEKKLAKQFVLNDKRYTTKHLLINEKTSVRQEG